MRILGWDIGGANIKLAVLEEKGNSGFFLKSISRYFPMWDKSEDLSLFLKGIYKEVGPADVMGLTMTAELADAFLDKKEGVEFILSQFEGVFSGIDTYLCDVDGKLWKIGDVGTVWENPLFFAGANWAVSALVVSKHIDNVVFTDIGSTTTDIIPIVDGIVKTRGKTDTERLKWGELLYLGALRTDLSTLVQEVPYRGEWVRVVREYFTNTADLHLISGHIDPSDYTVPTPDGREASRFYAGNRLARLISLDHTLFSEEDLTCLGKYIFEKELQLLEEGLLQVYSRVSPNFKFPLFSSGVGAFLIEIIASRLGIPLAVVDDSSLPSPKELNPAAGMALLVRDEVAER